MFAIKKNTPCGYLPNSKYLVWRSLLIILFNVKAGRLIFKNPIVGIISVLPTAIFIYRGSKPLVFGINSWIDRKRNEFVDSKEVVDAEVVSKEEA